MLQDSSSKIMMCLVGDLLDFELLSNGKFRKAEEEFNVKKTISEVVLIQEYKAMKMGVKIETFFHNFDHDSQISSLFENDDNYIIKTDEHRLV